MRKGPIAPLLPVTLAFAAVSILAAVACGGAKTPVDAAKADASASSDDAATAPVDDAGPTTTTTDSLGDAGAGQKLAPVEAGVAATDRDAGARKGDGGAFPPDPGRGAKDIEAIVKARRDDARKCYDDGLKAHPGIEGDLVVQWIVDPDGNVKKIDLNAARSQITEPSVVACVIDIIKKIKFAPSPRGMESTYNYPFNFHPRPGR